MKKLLIDVNSIVPYYVSGKINGIGRTTLELIQALADIDDLPFEIELYSQNMKGIGGRNIGLPFECSHFYLPHRDKLNKILARYPIREWFTGYDIMHIPHNFEYVHRPEKCIVTLHDALFMHIQEKTFAHEKMKEIVPPFISQCRHIITCSEHSKKDIVETMGVDPQKISVIYWGVKHEVFFPMQVSKEMLVNDLSLPLRNTGYFLSVSCNNERKRTNVLVESYLKYGEFESPVNDLVLVWSNPPKELIEKIAYSKVKDHVHFLSNISDNQLSLLYNGATALFFPSMFEGFGLPLLEGMACGTPIVTCRNSSLDEIGGEVAFYLSDPIDEGIIEMMKIFNADSVDCRQRVKAGIKRASLFTWERTAEQTVKVYEKSLNNNSCSTDSIRKIC